ncbi:MAG: alpha/beta fold hydrolase [Acidobacteriaceae bacterium]|nr:alpha/beta fold hydrolase [Acidobacteriaceae bacterium]
MQPPEPFSNDLIDGFLHVPEAVGDRGIALTHGAGGNCQTRLLTALAEAFALQGFHVLRFNLPFRTSRRSGPPFPAQSAKDRLGIASAVSQLRSIVSGPIVLGGHSYGGRQASILASESNVDSAALLLLSYPLHPPKKPAELRTSHFPELRTPSLFVQGTADPFGTVEELRSAIASIPAPTVLSVVEKAAHDLKDGRFDVRPAILEPLEKLLLAR